MGKLKAIQIGIGGMGRGHCKRLLEGTDFQLVAVCDRYPEREDVTESRTAAAAAGIPFYTDYHEAFRKHKADACLIATPHPFHAPMTIDALHRGMAVFTEKPAASSTADVRRMIKASEEAGRPVAVGFNPTADPGYVGLKHHIANGDLGQIREVVVVVNWFREDDYYTRSAWVGKEKVEGKWCRDGVMFNQSSHFFAAALMLASTAPWPAFAQVTGVRSELYRGHPVPQLEMEDLACAVMQVDGDPSRRVVFYGTTLNPARKSKNWIVVFGEKGRAVVGSGKIELYNGKTITVKQPKLATKHGNLRLAITKGATPLCPIAEGAKVTEAIEAVYKAAKGGIKPVNRDNLGDLSEVIARAAAQRCLFSEMVDAPAWAGAEVDNAASEGYALPS